MGTLALLLRPSDPSTFLADSLNYYGGEPINHARSRNARLVDDQDTGVWTTDSW